MNIFILSLNDFKSIKRYPNNHYIAITSPGSNITTNNSNVTIEEKGSGFDKTRNLFISLKPETVYITSSVASTSEDGSLVNLKLFDLFNELEINYIKLNLNKLKRENDNTSDKTKIANNQKEEPEAITQENDNQKQEEIDYYGLSDPNYTEELEDEADSQKSKKIKLFSKGRDAPNSNKETQEDEEHKQAENKQDKKESAYNDKAEHEKLNKLKPYTTQYEDLDSIEKKKYNQYKTQIEERKKAKKLISALEETNTDEEFFIFSDSDVADYKTINHREINLRKKLSAFIPEVETCNDKTFDEIIELIYFNPTLSEFLTGYKNKYSKDLSNESFDADTYKAMYIAVNSFIKLCSVIHLEI